MQSAFEVENGKRFIIETNLTTIIVYQCDQYWAKISEVANLNLMRDELKREEEDYHHFLRKSYLPEFFVKEESTELVQQRAFSNR